MTADRTLGQAAWEPVQALVVGIGPRPAGSEAEQHAVDYAAGLPLHRGGRDRHARRPGFCRRLEPGSPTRVVNFDMVGAGDTLRYASGDGTLWPGHTDVRLNALVQATRPEARRLWSTLRSGDFLPFLQRGVRAASLQTSGSSRAARAYHPVYDTLDVVELKALETTAQTALQVVARLAD